MTETCGPEEHKEFIVKERTSIWPAVLLAALLALLVLLFAGWYSGYLWLGDFGYEKKRMAAELAKRPKVVVCPVAIAFARDSFVPDKSQEENFKKMAEWLEQNWNNMAPYGEFALIGHGDKTPKDLSFKKDRVNPWLSLQRAVMAKLLLFKEGKLKNFSPEQNVKVTTLAASNLFPVVTSASTEDDHQKNRQVYLVFVSPGVRGFNTPGYGK